MLAGQYHQVYGCRVMSKAEILAELDKLTPDEWREIRRRLDELEGIEWLDKGALTAREKRIILKRLDACEKDPNGFIPWDEAKARLKSEFKR
jgi:hypothetical protein